MTKERDPLGKRALFSPRHGEAEAQGAENGAEAEPVVASSPARPSAPARKPGPLDVTVTCSSCEASSTVSAPEIALKHLPVIVWLPWRKQSLLMRCPACNHLAWHAASRG